MITYREIDVETIVTGLLWRQYIAKLKQHEVVLHRRASERIAIGMLGHVGLALDHA